MTFHAFQGGQNSEAAVPSGGVVMDVAGNFMVRRYSVDLDLGRYTGLIQRAT